MDTKFTPGPWRWEIEDHSMANVYGTPIGDSVPHVLTITPCKSCQDSIRLGANFFGTCYMPTVANAHLIAAAPELFEACRIARLHAESIRLAPERRHTIAVLDAAISKALGNGIEG